MKSQLSVLQRSEISNPPTYGARLVSGRMKLKSTDEIKIETGFAYFK